MSRRPRVAALCLCAALLLSSQASPQPDPLTRIVSRTGQLSPGDAVMVRLVEGSGERWYADFVERK